MTEETQATQQQQLPSPNLWTVLTQCSDEVAAGALVDYIERLDASPQFRRGELTNLLGLLQGVLLRADDDIDGDAVAQIGVGHVVLIAHTLLRRLD